MLVVLEITLLQVEPEGAALFIGTLGMAAIAIRAIIALNRSLARTRALLAQQLLSSRSVELFLMNKVHL